jgi:PKD repeat protein
LSGNLTPFTVTFHATYIHANTWLINFGDGNFAGPPPGPIAPSGSISVMHTYNIVGTYPASLTLNGLNTTKQTIFVNATAE